MTELLSRSSTMPPATAPRGWHMRFPPWVKKKSLSQAVVTKPVLLGNGTETKTEPPLLPDHELQVGTV